MPVSILYCPHCGRPMSLPPGAAPVSLECPHCRHVFSLNLTHGPRGVLPPRPYGDGSADSTLKTRLLARLGKLFSS